MAEENDSTVESSNKTDAFVSDLEDRLRAKSAKVEELHMEAAIDFEFSGLNGDDSPVENETNSNPNSVANCLSPYVPTKAERMGAFISWVKLTGPDSDEQEDVLLDIGCGDGRVCVAASKICGKFQKVYI
jgi:hypothetical protein